METIDASDDEDDPFKDLREEGEFSGGVSHAVVLNDAADDADADGQELCTICGK